MAKCDWWTRGKPYNCNQCGRICYQGVMHKCSKALKVDRVHHMPIDRASKAFRERLVEGFTMSNGGQF